MVEKGSHKLKILIVKKKTFPTGECWNVRCPMCRNTALSEPGDLKRHTLPWKTLLLDMRFYALIAKKKARQLNVLVRDPLWF